MRKMFSLSPKNGGLRIINPASTAKDQFDVSKESSNSIVKSVVKAIAENTEEQKSYVLRKSQKLYAKKERRWISATA